MSMSGTANEPSGEARQRLPVGNEVELRGLLLPLCRALAPLHEAGRFHGGLSWSSIRLNEQGRVLLEESTGPAGLKRTAERNAQAPLLGVLQDGYAAFEQYMEEDAWPLGPWTDVHALCALAYEAVTGETPANAVQRMKHETEIVFPAAVQVLYPPVMLAAIARGLALDAGRRQQNVHEFMAALVWSLNEPAVQEEVKETPVLAVGTQTALNTRRQTAARAWGRPALVLALFAAGLGVWAASGNDRSTESLEAPDAQGIVTPPVETAQTESQASQTLQEEVALAGLETLSTDELPAQAEATVTATVEQLSEPAAEIHAVETMPTYPEPAETDPERVAQQAAGTVAMPQPAPVPAPAPSPETVSVALSIQPWGEIFVDGESRGVSPPLRQLKLAPGSYRIRIQNGDLPPSEQQLLIQPGEPARLSHVFSKDGDPAMSSARSSDARIMSPWPY